MPWRALAQYPPSTAKCTVYLLHFTKPLGHACHYIGATKRGEVGTRLEEHAQGRGARLCRHAVANGAKLVLARVWDDVPRYYELRLKNRGGARKLCPICKAAVDIGGK